MKVWLPARCPEDAVELLAQRYEFMDRERTVVLESEECPGLPEAAVVKPSKAVPVAPERGLEPALPRDLRLLGGEELVPRHRPRPLRVLGDKALEELRTEARAERLEAAADSLLQDLRAEGMAARA